MALTSEWFAGAVVVAVVVLPILTVLLWNRLRGPRAARFVVRFGLIAMCQGTAVLLAALLINNSFQLYASWSDLLGENGAPGPIQQAHAASLQTGSAKAAGVAGADRLLPNGHLFTSYRSVPDAFTALVAGPKSQVSGTVLVWLPPEYFEPGYAHTEFPVVQLMSGSPGQPSSWFEGMNGPGILAQTVAAHGSQPFILVSASINVDGSHNPDCSDIPGGPLVATWLAQDVRTLVETSFRTFTDRAGWGLMGYSEGGLCASKLLLQYPDRYSAAVSMSGDDHPGGDLLKPGSLAYNQNSPLWILQNEPPEPVALLLTGTLQDGSTAAEADAMGKAAKPPVTVDKLIAARGGHNVGVWKALEPKAFGWLSAHLGLTSSGALAAPLFSAVPAG
jgi:pimeloyl-ACP methyl ester carboxylesterase